MSISTERIFATDPSDGSVGRSAAHTSDAHIFSGQTGCKPLPIVVTSGSDAQGIYSDVVDPSFNTVGKNFYAAIK
jgi:hypothetical protein